MLRFRAWGLLLLLASCTPGAEPPAPAVETPAAWQAKTGAGPVWLDAVWWRGFQPPALNRLIEAARGGSFDLAAAIACVRQADAQVRINGASLLPTLDPTAPIGSRSANATCGTPGKRWQ
jgi:outer membrane protein TolC